MTEKQRKKQKRQEQIHILMVSLTITLATLFVITGIGVVAIQGGHNGIDPGNLPASVELREDFLYQVSFMGDTTTVDLSPLNEAAGFFHRNSFLIPPPLRFLQQAACCVYLAVTDYQTFTELVFPWNE